MTKNQFPRKAFTQNIIQLVKKLFELRACFEVNFVVNMVLEL